MFEVTGPTRVAAVASLRIVPVTVTVHRSGPSSFPLNPASQAMLPDGQRTVVVVVAGDGADVVVVTSEVVGLPLGLVVVVVDNDPVTRVVEVGGAVGSSVVVVCNGGVRPGDAGGGTVTAGRVGAKASTRSESSPLVSDEARRSASATSIARGTRPNGIMCDPVSVANCASPFQHG